ncbi:PfkB family carbohydrate kinase [Lamprobacter modestohalophilus]|uniref:PfkB family carbohydrate kinase n=1 Tax=Lamprobacter modestohalophilus TaxID=1064514 RepID=UPI002ADEDC3E|nr:PfkB family carbohydrate kinase [Lamprobacter modestohalophilus]MEA1052770.1 PfkB family carbohydrate kinase [Lamprobacter modestohalophilus]
MSLRDQEHGLVVVAEQLRRRANARNLIVKLAAEGALLHVQAENGHLQTDRIPALNPAPQDVAGAGDSLLTAASLTLAAGGSIWQAALLGSLAAAVQISRLGNRPLSAEALLARLEATGQ